MQVYVVDTNFFIQAHRVHYPMDVFPGFWKKVKELADRGILVSIDRVKKEIEKNEDDLKVWVNEQLATDFFKSIETLDDYRRVIAWANRRRDHYLTRAIEEFSDYESADAFLIAYCLRDVDNRILVTQEVSDAKRKNKIKIPDVCNEFNIRYVNTVQMFRALQETI